MAETARFIGRYRILGLLGRGGMGEVFRAHDPLLNRDVAIKLLPAGAAQRPDRLKRFSREARAIAALNHPNIVTIHEHGDIDGERYLVMEVVEGETLLERLRRGRLAPSAAHDIAIQLAEGLAHAHDAGVIHRDLKPGNVMVKADGLVKILDFGLGKIIDRDSAGDNDDTTEAVDASHHGPIVGTFDYMAPEQARGDVVDHRCDQFAFGSVLYEMLTGARAFHRASPASTLAAIIAEPPAAVPTLAPDTPVALARIVERCHQKTREARYSSTRLLVADLKAARDDGRLSSSTAPSGARSWRTTAAVAATSLCIAALIAVARPATPERLPSVTSRQVVVLPFANVTGDATSQAFSDGIVEQLTSSLTQLEQFQHSIRVVPAADVRRVGIASTDEARQSFQATLVVTGSILRTAERIRITLNLVDADTRQQLKARVVDASPSDVLAVQDAVVDGTASMLALALGAADRSALTAGKSLVPSASDYYLQGLGYLRRFERAENLDVAASLFQRAIADDGRFVLAYAGLGEAYWRKFELTRDASLVALARASIERAVALDDRLAQVRVTQGLVNLGTGQYESAIREFQRALAIDPVNLDAHREMARAYAALGEWTAAENAYKEAIAVRSGDWSTYSALGAFYTSRGRFEEALAQFRRVIELTPDNAGAYSNRGGIEFYLGRFDEAISDFERSVALTPTAAAYSNLGTLYFRRGQMDQARQAFERALGLSETDYRVWGNLGATYRALGAPVERIHEVYARAVDLAEAERALDLRRGDATTRLSEYYAYLGDRERARAMMATASQLVLDASDLMSLASTALTLGDTAEALRWLQRGIDAGYSRSDLEASKAFESLRGDARFQAIIRR